MAAAENQNAPFFVDREVIQLTKNGVWIADGVEITHEPTRRLFARSLKRDPDGGYTLHIGRETKRIEVEDLAFFVTRIDGDAEKGFELSLSDESREKLDPTTLEYRPGRLTCRIKGGAETAKFLSVPYFDLLRNLDEDGNSYYLVLGNCRVDLLSKA